MRTIHADLTPIELAYLAGIIDGEGSINITRDTHRGEGKENYILRLSIVNTSKDMIDWISSRVEGNHVEYPPKGNWRRRYEIKWNGQEAVAIILKVFPYLVAKEAQALLALRFIKCSSSSMGYGRIDKDKQKVICQEMKRLNRGANYENNT